MNNKRKPQKYTDINISPSEFDGLVSFEEIDSYKLYKEINHNGTKSFISEEKQKGKKNLKRRKSSKHKDNSPKLQCGPKSVQIKRKREEDREEKNSCPAGKKTANFDLQAWKEIFTPDCVIEAIRELGFCQPTPIQKLTIPAAIKGRKDILGAAETGSGKTLAFVIPIIHGILKKKENENKIESDYVASEQTENDEEGSDEEGEQTENDEEGSDEESEQTENDEERSDEECSEEGFQSGDEGLGCVKVIDNANFDFVSSQSINKEGEKSPQMMLKALIITPTRELAVQIKKHTDAVLSKTDIKTALVIGGLSHEKQERLLRRSPEIVIGTPGRLWELVQQGNFHLSQLSELSFLAIDETDRMLEKGHFEELQKLLELLNGDPESKRRRQNFVFSATLTLTHGPPKRLKSKKRKVKEITSEMKIEHLMKLVGMRVKPKIADITRKFGTAETLSESKILCSQEEKDEYLYYFLNRFPGRTLIFCNSINCVRRLSNLLSILQCKPLALHASKQQKQRLKSLERFTSNPEAVLLATDVAARGIDIPGVDHIIHYEVPKTAETYVHRSGRTARANQEGVSVLLVDAKEITKYRQLCITLNRSSDIPNFPVDFEILGHIKQRVLLARDIENSVHRTQKKKKEDDWLHSMAEEAGLEVSGSETDEEEVYESALGIKRSDRELQLKKSRLAHLLSRSLTSSIFSRRFPTSSGKLVWDTNQNNAKSTSECAISLLKTVNRKGNKGIEKVKLKK